jgi:hypothetical protein
MKSSWYDFAIERWRFVVLDGMDISVAGRDEGAPEHTAASVLLASLEAARAPNAEDWNGGVGEKQLQWLRNVLGQARERRERVIVFCHQPVIEESSTPQFLAWNCGEIRAVLEESGVVMAWMNGHDHDGGYAESRGIHYVTLPGMVESGSANSYTLVDVFDGRLELRGTGAAPSRTLALS